MNVGTSCVYTGEDNEYIYPDLMMRIRALPNVDVFYLDYVLKSPLTRSYYMAVATGSSESMPKINQETVANTLIPLPPFAEQKRIVVKLDELLPRCDCLERNQTDAFAKLNGRGVLLPDRGHSVMPRKALT